MSVPSANTRASRNAEQAARDADQRFLRERPRHGHGVEAHYTRGGWPSKDAAEEGDPRWTASRVDLVFGFELGAPCPRRRSTRAPTRRSSFARDFVAAWDKVMNLDRFDSASDCVADGPERDRLDFRESRPRAARSRVRRPVHRDHPCGRQGSARRRSPAGHHRPPACSLPAYRGPACWPWSCWCWASRRCRRCW